MQIPTVRRITDQSSETAPAPPRLPRSTLIDQEQLHDSSAAFQTDFAEPVTPPRATANIAIRIAAPCPSQAHVCDPRGSDLRRRTPRHRAHPCAADRSQARLPQSRHRPCLVDEADAGRSRLSVGLTVRAEGDRLASLIRPIHPVRTGTLRQTETPPLGQQHVDGRAPAATDIRSASFRVAADIPRKVPIPASPSARDNGPGKVVISLAKARSSQTSDGSASA